MKTKNQRLLLEQLSKSLSMIEDLYRNAKPHMILMNLLAFSGGFIFHTDALTQLPRLLAALLGVGFMVGAACVINNIVDRKHDKQMKRTAYRPLASGRISLKVASAQAATFIILGVIILLFSVNLLTIVIGVGSLLFYATVYGFLKRRFRYGTLSGSIPGSLVVLAGYTASSGAIDTRGVILFCVVLVCMLASYRKVLRRRQPDYARAGLPVMIRA